MAENKIIFTQDVPGEREWFQSYFPGYTNLETASSGKWPCAFPENSDQSNLYEIAYSDHHDISTLLNCNVSKIKSCYNNDPDLVIADNIHWVCADQFVSNVSYQPFVDQPKFWVLHIARSGTKFVEALLRNYRSMLQFHAGTGTHAHLMELFNTAKMHPEVAIVFVYRPELWEVLTSTVLAVHYGYHHGDSFDWSLAKPIAISVDDMLKFQTIVVSTLNFWCNLRFLLPTHSMLLLNGSETIRKYKHQVDHDRVAYNKQDLISNYAEAKEQWNSMFDKDLSKMLSNAIAHLTNMNCKSNLNHLV